MGKGIILWPNLIDDRVTPPVFSGGGWLADLPLSNLRDDGVQTGYLAYAAQSNTAAEEDTCFDIDHGQPVPCAGLAIPDGNWSPACNVTVTRANDADFTDVVATATGEVYPVLYPLGTQPSTSPYLISGKPTIRLPKMPFIALFDPVHVARYTRVEISDPLNPDGYIRIPRLFMAGGYEPFYNMQYGARLRPIQRTRVRESVAGARFFDERAPRRVWTLEYDLLPQAELLASMYEMQATLGVSRQAFFIFDPADTVSRHRTSFMCTLDDPGGIVFSSYERGGASLVLSEVIA
ncbi:hypothetical protein [Oceanibaculum nanhaiense]|uniref:hypothetical protein n=1 Tax=Oceanibaculum nanhaiense TaxID=1909734 RepID=UPI003D2AF6AA